MTMTKDEALKLAFEALKQIDEAMPFPAAKLAITAIKEALAKEKALQALHDENERLGLYKDAYAEQEPVACVQDLGEVKRKHLVYKKGMDWKDPLYTTPPQRKPLTDKQILADETLRYYFGQNGGAGPVSKQGRKVVNAIEALHNIKE